jgi:hypothetical protein
MAPPVSACWLNPRTTGSSRPSSGAISHQGSRSPKSNWQAASA